MYTRLYTQVLNRNGWVENCNVINHAYSDSSLFGISLSVPSDVSTHHHMANVICDQMVICTNHCTKTELNRAKNQLKSNILMSLESQPVQLEDLGRQILISDNKMDVNEMCRRIDLVSEEDIIRVGRRVFLGENIPSRFDFNDELYKPWEKTGQTNPTILVEGPLTGSKDTLWKVEESLGKWGLKEGAAAHRKKRFFNF
jgi:processing peptidase subunit alpha